MSDDRNNDDSGGGFDDWLDEEPGAVTDPTLVDDETPSEADTEPLDQDVVDVDTNADDTESEHDDTGSDHDGTSEVDVVDVDTNADDTESEHDDTGSDHDGTSEVDVVDVDTNADDTESEHDDTGSDHDGTSEVDVVDVDTNADDTESEHDDTGSEIEVVTTGVEDTGELNVVEIAAAGSDGTERDDDTGEVFAGAAEGTDVGAFSSQSEAGFGGSWAESETDGGDGAASAAPESAGDTYDVTESEYLQAATKEHEGLAELIAQTQDEDTEQAALAAHIPGLDSTIVGFEDVVEAEGHGKVRARAPSDLVARVATGIVLVLALGASLFVRPVLIGLALVVFLLGAGEFYTALLRSGRKPIALFGFLGIAGASLGAVAFGAIAIPISFIAATTVLLLFYAVVPGKVDPVGSLALTITVMVWVGLGSFTMLIAQSENYRALVIGVVVTVAAMDIAQYFFGRALGRHPLSPWVSPKKTVEGLVAGVVVALAVGSMLHFLEPFELTSGLAIGAAVAVFAPIGDLAMSAAKRSLGLKDMGSVLPGHGGFLDRIDGLIFVLPVAWMIFLRAGIL